MIPAAKAPHKPHLNATLSVLRLDLNVQARCIGVSPLRRPGPTWRNLLISPTPRPVLLLSWVRALSQAPACVAGPGLVAERSGGQSRPLTRANDAIKVTIYTRPACPRTAPARQLLAEARRRYPIDLREVDISLDVTLELAYGKDTPVVYIEGAERFRRQVDQHELYVLLQARQMKMQHHQRRPKDI